MNIFYEIKTKYTFKLKKEIFLFIMNEHLSINDIYALKNLIYAYCSHYHEMKDVVYTLKFSVELKQNKNASHYAMPAGIRLVSYMCVSVWTSLSCSRHSHINVCELRLEVNELCLVML